MGDQDDGAAPAQPDERCDELSFGRLIECTRCFVQQQYWPISVQRTRDADSLPLSCAQRDSPLTDAVVVFAGQRLDELLELRQAGRLDQPLRVDGRLRDAERDVFRNARIQNERILWDIGNPSAPGRAVRIVQ